MTSNVHGHIHLPLQVLQTGPLNKNSVFHFENMFQVSEKAHHGTRNLEGFIFFVLRVEKPFAGNYK